MELLQAQRAAGVLMPVSSLPGPCGIGDFGPTAYDFVRFLAKARQRYWQILPLGPTGYGDSPYQSFCAFAGNPYFISLQVLRDEGLLTDGELRRFQRPPGPVDYGDLYATRIAALRLAAGRMREAACEEFYAAAFWLDDYALFMALKETQGGVSWQGWPRGLRMRDAQALLSMRDRLDDEISFWKKTQFLFYSQWRALKDYANEAGVQIIGDIPIYVSPDSSDVWAQPKLFCLDENRRQAWVAGVPPDGFSADGQVWGNPLYDWKAHAETDFAWWGRRLGHAASVYDVTRIDHFRGFCDYYTIPAGEETAKNGVWLPGPGQAFLDSVKRRLPEIRIIAEDLGFLSPQVEALLQYSGFPGMKVLQFAFDSREESDYLPYRYPINSVVYTGTHDNTTTADWELSAPAEDVAYAKRYFALCDGQSLTRAMVREALASVSCLAVIPLQDWMELGKEARVNTPSTMGGNWIWRIKKEDLTLALAEKIGEWTALYGRASGKNKHELNT